MNYQQVLKNQPSGKQSTAKAIIFDFFGVIRTDAYIAWLQKNHIPHEGAYFDASYQQDIGKSTNEEFFRRLSELQGRSVTKEEMDVGAIVDEAVVTIVKTLKQRYKLALLSNSAGSVRRLLKENNLEQYFDEVIISSEVGMVKPSPEIFKLALNRLGVTASETVFIDDNSNHVQAAEKLGIKSIWFKSAEQLKEKLHNLDIKLENTLES